MELSGIVVLRPGVYSHADDLHAEILTEVVINNLKHAQNYKIDMCHCLYVINPGGYIGDDTREEIAYAIHNNKRIMFLESEDEENQVFNSMTGITDAVAEITDGGNKTESCTSNAELLVDASSSINPYGDVIRGLEDIQEAIQEAKKATYQPVDDDSEESEEDEIDVTDEQKEIRRFTIGGIILICALIIGFGIHLHLIGKIHAKYETTMEKLVELDEQIDEQLYGIKSA